MKDQMLFRVGDTVKVTQKVQEAKRERSVPFNGTVIDIKGSGMNRMFTVRETIDGVTVDRIFPLQSPTISDIKVVETPKKRVRRATLSEFKN